MNFSIYHCRVVTSLNASVMPFILMNGGKKTSVLEWTPECAVNAMRPPWKNYSTVTVSCNNQPRPFPPSTIHDKKPLFNSFTRIFSKTAVQFIDVAHEGVASLVKRCIESTDRVITMDRYFGNVCKLPDTCHRNIDQSHLVHHFFRHIANGSFSCLKYSFLKPGLAFKNLKDIIPLSHGLRTVFNKGIYFHIVVQTLLRFDVAEEKEKLLLLIKKHPCHRTDLNALFFAVHCIAYLKAFLLVLFRTEDFDGKIKDAVLEKCSLFFSSVQFDVGHGKSRSHICDYISVLQDSDCDNYSTQLSTESSYHLGHCLHIRRQYTLDGIKRFQESLSGVYLCAVNTDYGCTYVKELL